MGIIKDYRIAEKDLFIIEYSYWTFKPQKLDAVKVWHLTNVSLKDPDIIKLEELKDYQETVEIKELHLEGMRPLLEVYCGLHETKYVFECEQIQVSTRPYDKDELIEMIIRSEESLQEDNSTIHRLEHQIDQIKLYLANQIRVKSIIIDQISDIESRSNHKAKIQLDILRKIYKIVSEDEN